MSPRRVFVSALSVLSAIAAAITAWPTLAWQGDAVADLLKIGLFTALATTVISFVLWTLFVRPTFTTRRYRLAAAIVGAVSAALIVPLPLFGWALKTGLLEMLGENTLSLSGLFELGLTAIQHGLFAFVQFTKASLGAMILSAALGYAVARFIPPRR